MAPLLISDLLRRRWPRQRLESSRATISLPERMGNLPRQSISKKEKTKIGHYTNRLQKNFEVSITKCEDVQTLRESLATLFGATPKTLAVKRRGRGFRFGGDDANSITTWHHALWSVDGSNSGLCTWMVNRSRRSMACDFAKPFIHCRKASIQLIRPRRVGYVLRAHVLKALIGQGVRQYDFLGGEEASKFRWGAQKGNYTDIHFARPLTRGAIHLRMTQTTHTLKNWFRTSLPAPLLRAFRKAKSKKKLV